MKEYSKEISEEILNLITKVKNSTSLPLLKYEVIGDAAAKTPITVNINSDMVRVVSDFDFIIVVNEFIFNELQEESKIIAIESALAFIEYDLDKDTIKKNMPDYSGHSGILKKYGYEKIEILGVEISQIAERLKENKGK